MARTRHYRDLIAWQKAMDLARQAYERTEDFPNSETFGLRMQLRRSAVSRCRRFERGLASARGSLNELQTQAKLPGSLGFLDKQSTDTLLDLSIEVAKLINGLIGSLAP